MARKSFSNLYLFMSCPCLFFQTEMVTYLATVALYISFFQDLLYIRILATTSWISTPLLNISNYCTLKPIHQGY